MSPLGICSRRRLRASTTCISCASGQTWRKLFCVPSIQRSSKPKSWTGYVEFEFIGAQQYLAEKAFSRGLSCTSVDAFMVGRTAAGRRAFLGARRALGHEVHLMPPQYVKARNKNDAADAEAICEAVRRPSMHFVPVKTKEQQSALVMHRGRELLIRQQTMLANALRGHLAEFGLIAAQGLHNVAGLIATRMAACRTWRVGCCR